MEIMDILNRQKAELKTKKWDNRSAINCFLGDGQPGTYEVWKAAGEWLSLHGPEPYKSYARKVLKIPRRGPAHILQFPTIIPAKKKAEAISDLTRLVSKPAGQEEDKPE